MMNKTKFNDLGAMLFVTGLLLFSTAHAQVLKLRADGPNAKELGQEQGYKACAQALIKPECRVGAWSAPAPISSNAIVKPSSNPWTLADHEQAPHYFLALGFVISKCR
jgi:hypothetical protein